MKKIVHIILSVILMLSLSAGLMYYVFLDVAQKGCKYASKGNIAAHKNIEVIKIPIEDYNNRQQSDEIWHNGALYDISSVTITNGFAYVSVYHDVQEEAIVNIEIAGMEQDTRFNTDKTNHITKHRVTFADDNKILDTITVYESKPNIGLNTNVFYYLRYSLTSVFTSVIKPPPKYIFV